MKTIKTRTRRLVSDILAAAKAPGQNIEELNQKIHVEIQLKAYELFLARGCKHGHDLDDWEKAEKTILAKFKIKK